MKKGSTGKKVILGFFLLLLAAALFLVLHLYTQKKQEMYQLSVDENALQNVSEGEASYRKIEVDGKIYRYNTGITNILYMGIDTETEQDEIVSDAKAGQADSIMLLSIDRRTEEIHVIAIPRDTITGIRMYDNAGQYLGKAQQHLSLAYAYGDGGETSCRLVEEAVSQLLNDIPMDNYIASNISSIGAINDLVGGVTVTIPNRDLEYLGSRWKKGNRITLSSATAEIFLRRRDITKDFTNTGRMERQQVYFEAFFEQLAQSVKNDLDGFMDDLEDMDELSQTDLRSSEIEQLLSMAVSGGLKEENYHILEGEDVVGELHDEFYVDEEKLDQLILDIYYVEVS